MKVVYTAPNRSHHYKYALALHQAGVLLSFVNGFSRYSPRAEFKEIGDKMDRVDFIQNMYLASLKFHAPKNISSELAYLAKIQQDRACAKYMLEADIFLYYNGSGLSSTKKIQAKGGIAIAEAVNSHVQYQEDLLREEYKMLNLPWLPFHQREKKRRVDEYQQADYILMPSEFVKNSFIEMGFPAEKLLKVPYGFNQLSTPGSISKNEGEVFTVLYVGSISIRKGLRYLIEAFKKFKHPNKRLVIVGPESDRRGISDLSMPSEIVFTGELKSAELENAYKSATVFCLPSIEEGLALVIGEALSFGKPIITTTNSGASEIITDGKEGFIVPIRNSDAIAEKLELLADDKVVYNSMKEAASQRAASLLGWQETGKKLVDTLETVHKKTKNLTKA